MKICHLILTSLFMNLAGNFYAQVNLVPNPSFEQYDTCPTNQSDIQHAVGWNSFGQTPVYFNSCASQFSTVSIPSNDAGYQFAASGNAYTCLYSYFPNSYQNREYLGGTLLSSLIIGTKYYVSLVVSLSAIDSAWGYTRATNKMGVLFSTVPYSMFNAAPKNNFAHVYTDSIITDTLNWTTISGSFIADSAYQYIIIGNFFDSAHIDTVAFFNNTPYRAAVYFIDNVCVSTDSLYCASWAGIKAENISSKINIYPNPFVDFSIIDFDNISRNSFDFILYNLSGEIVDEIKNIRTCSFQVNRNNLPSGIYFFTLTDNEKYFSREGKLIIAPKN